MITIFAILISACTDSSKLDLSTNRKNDIKPDVIYELVHVNFEDNSSLLSKSSAKSLEKLVDILENNVDLKANFTVYSDNKKDKIFNLKRENIIRNVMTIEQKIPKERINVELKFKNKDENNSHNKIKVRFTKVQ